MKPDPPVVSRAIRQWRGPAALLCLFVLGLTPRVMAQTLPPIGGLTGTVATEETVADEHSAAGRVLTKMADGVRRLFGRGGTDAGAEAFRSVREGDAVVVHAAPSGSREDVARAGRVVGVDSKRQRLSVRFADRTLGTFQVVDRGGRSNRESVPGDVTVVTVSYVEEAGTKVAHLYPEPS